MEPQQPKAPFYERGIFGLLASSGLAAVLTAAGLILPPTTFANWLLIIAWILFLVPLWLAWDTLENKAASWFLIIVCWALIAIGLNSLWNMRERPKPYEAKQPEAPPANVVPAKPPPDDPRLEVGLTLGADKRIGIDSIADCTNPAYTCLLERELIGKHLVLDVGEKGWARLIIRFKNVGGSKLLHPVSHFESPNPVSIDLAFQPDSSRFPRNVLDVHGDDIYQFSVAQSQAALPLDVTVPEGTNSFDLSLNTFGDNMKAHKLTFHFDVKR